MVALNSADRIHVAGVQELWSFFVVKSGVGTFFADLYDRVFPPKKTTRLVTHISCDVFGNVRYVAGFDEFHQHIEPTKPFGPLDVETMMMEIESGARMYWCVGRAPHWFSSTGTRFVVRTMNGQKFLAPLNPQDMLNLEYF